MREQNCHIEFCMAVPGYLITCTGIHCSWCFAPFYTKLEMKSALRYIYDNHKGHELGSFDESLEMSNEARFRAIGVDKPKSREQLLKEKAETYRKLLNEEMQKNKQLHLAICKLLSAEVQVKEAKEHLKSLLPENWLE